MKNIVIDQNDCWNWKLWISPLGYGQISFKDKTELVHRVSFQVFIGKIKKNLEINHICRNRKCINPEHLETVSHRENLLKGDTIAAKNDQKTHCLNGHKFTPENTCINPSGERSCRICKNRRQRSYRSHQ